MKNKLNQHESDLNENLCKRDFQSINSHKFPHALLKAEQRKKSKVITIIFNSNVVHFHKIREQQSILHRENKIKIIKNVKLRVKKMLFINFP